MLIVAAVWMMIRYGVPTGPSSLVADGVKLFRVNVPPEPVPEHRYTLIATEGSKVNVGLVSDRDVVAFDEYQELFLWVYVYAEPLMPVTCPVVVHSEMSVPDPLA
jgi:hypothetical protein